MRMFTSGDLRTGFNGTVYQNLLLNLSLLTRKSGSKLQKKLDCGGVALSLLARRKELAADYGIDYYDWVTELLEASTINPRPMVRDGRKIAEKFEGGREVEIFHRNGTNLKLRLKGRRCFVDDGIVDEADVKAGFGESNVPAGVVTVAVDEAYAEGKFVSNRPTRHGPSKGRSDNGVWTFENGRLSKYDYEKGKRSFDRLYVTAGEERIGRALCLLD